MAYTVTCLAPVNIAVIKYWGKRDEDLILPINDSLSATLSLDNMCAKTTIMLSPNFTENQFWLNGKEELFGSKRLSNCLKEIKKYSSNKDIQDWKIHICSENNFPTAAGLASSAAGYACLVSALAKIYDVKIDLSTIARQGSGSACRSMYGGWVQWHMGSKSDGTDSIAKQIVTASYWPEMRILVLVVNDSRKKYSSSTGMQQSVLTSKLLNHRATIIVPERIERMRTAIIERNFNDFAKLTMEDSNQFHAVCLDTFPPCVYMNDISHAIVEMVHAYNDFKGENKVAYTFDAGPNACLYILENDVEEMISLVNDVFPTNIDCNTYFRGDKINLKPNQELKTVLKLPTQEIGSLKYVIYTKVGDGPRECVNSSEHLLNENGTVKN